jgi:protein-disulfide isomerase
VLGPALAGGIVGAAATAAMLFFAAPQLIGTRIVREGLLADPQILVETADALRDRQFAPTIDANRAALETPFGTHWKGAARPDVVVVEFFDYACAYCRASNSHIDQLIRADPGVRVVYRELPILGPNSVAAARASLAASKAGQFGRFYDTLFAAGRPAPQTVAAAAQAAGIEPAATQDPAIEAEIRRNLQLAGQLGATGTPTFVVGDRVLNGAVGYVALRKAVEAARDKA